jgi:TonB family protein
MCSLNSEGNDMKTLLLCGCIAVFALALCATLRAQTPTTDQPTVVAAVAPVFPAIARVAHVKDDVITEVTIQSDGTVRATKAVSGHPLLQKACEAAAKKWKFSPSSEGNRKVRLTFSFAVINGGKSDPEYTITFMPPYKTEVLWNPPPPGY